MDEACDRFTPLFLEIAIECIPRKKFLIQPNDQPWFTSNIRREIRDRMHKNILKQKIRPFCLAIKNIKKWSYWYAKENFFLNINGQLDELETTNQKEYWKLTLRLLETNANLLDLHTPYK